MWSQSEHHQPTLENNPRNQGNLQTNESPNKNRLRVNIKITSTNLNGAAVPSENMNYLAKWGAISREMHAKKIAVLAVQETHLDQAMMERLQETFKKNLKIIISAHPENPHAKAGVGFIINRQLLEPDEIETYELIPSKAMILKIKWMKTCTTSILNIYAPNKRSAHPHFWAKMLTE